jgi:hypothetical protein
MVRLVSTGSVRPLKMNYRSVTGRLALPDGTAATAESKLEDDWIATLRFDRRVKRIQVQPFHIFYDHNGKTKHYTPDVLVELQDKQRAWTEVHEVKFRSELREIWTEFRPRFKAAYKQCRESGHRFRIVTDRKIRTPYLANVKFFTPFMTREPQPPLDAALTQALTKSGPSTPKALLGAVATDLETRMQAQAALWRLIAVHEVAAELNGPFTMFMKIWMPEP